MHMQGPPVMKRDTCRLCGGEIEKMFSFAPTPPGDKYSPIENSAESEVTYPLDVVLCNYCGLLQLAHTINPEILYGDYTYLTSNSLGLVEHFKRYSEDILMDLHISEQSFVIDVGCNDGVFLTPFKEHGMKTLGIEPASKIAEKAREKGIPIVEHYLTSDVAEKIVREHGKAQIITANNVFANVDNPAETIRSIKKMLSPQGVFVFETGYMPDTISNNVFDNFYHEHLSYFSVKPLESFFRTEGMEIIDIKHLPTKGGSIRGFVQFKGGPREVEDSVAEYLNLEKEKKMDNPETFREFYQEINAEGERLRKILQSIKDKGESIVGYGASIGVTTMIYEWKLKDFLDFLVDDNESRFGLVSPGLHFPVRSSKEIYEKGIKNVLILAWRYADPIISKHEKYIQESGRFIVPFSESKIEKTY